MGILDGIFGKAESDALRAALADKSARVEKLELELAECRQSLAVSISARDAVGNENSTLRARLSDLEPLAKANPALLAKIDSLEADLIQAWDGEETFKSRVTRLEDELAQSRSDADRFAGEAKRLDASHAELKSEYIRLSQQNQNIKSAQAEHERQLAEREAKLQEKSKRLQEQQVAITNRTSELQRQEKKWKQSVEPQLHRFEAHLSLEMRELACSELESKTSERAKALDHREGELARLGITAERLRVTGLHAEAQSNELQTREAELVELKDELSRQSDQLERRRKELDAKTRSLASFQSQIDNLKEEEASLQKRVDTLDRKEARRNRDWEKKREEIQEEYSQLRVDKDALKRREDELVDREREVARIAEQLSAFKRSNSALRDQLVTTKQQLEDCLQLRAKQSSSPGLRIAQGPRKPDPGDDVTVLPPISKPSLALRSNSPLTGAGYHVGSSGIKDEQERRDLLESFISTPLARLPKVGDSAYMKLWGEANTRMRIRYVAYHIYWNIEFQGARDTMDLARDHWLKDLKWLKRAYSESLPAEYWPEIPRR
jgi:chromosome segregation ATPase